MRLFATLLNNKNPLLVGRNWNGGMLRLCSDGICRAQRCSTRAAELDHEREEVEAKISKHHRALSHCATKCTRHGTYEELICDAKIFAVCTSRSDLEKTMIFQTATALCMISSLIT